MDGLVKILTDYGDKDKRMSKEEAEDLISQVSPIRSCRRCSPNRISGGATSTDGNF